jgi:hypothetical protein
MPESAEIMPGMPMISAGMDAQARFPDQRRGARA